MRGRAQNPCREDARETRVSALHLERQDGPRFQALRQKQTDASRGDIGDKGGVPLETGPNQNANGWPTFARAPLSQALLGLREVSGDVLVNRRRYFWHEDSPHRAWSSSLLSGLRNWHPTIQPPSVCRVA